MENETKIARGVAADKAAAIHHGGHFFEAFGKFDIIDCGVDARKRAEDAVRFEAFFVRRVALWIECFSMSHAATHPENDHGVGSGFGRGGFGCEDGACVTGRQRAKCRSARRL